MKISRHRLPATLAVLLLIFLCCVQFQTPPTAFGQQQFVPAQNAGLPAVPGDEQVVGIARIIHLDKGSVQLLFNERQSPFTITTENPEFGNIIRIAELAFAEKKPVKMLSTAPGVLKKLSTPSETELQQYNERMRLNLRLPEEVRAVDLRKIDTAVFNTVAWQKWKVFNLCVKAVPNLATAQTIFDYCKQQSCKLAPTQEQPCIPFQYVRDGCFARAHKMKQIIEKKYGYCTEKVFSFGDYLHVQAAGGCCVSWWYHVAPLIRVQMSPGIQICYVIDPGMFSAPVTLFTWLYAQENKTCDNSAHLLTYSIQPSSAYTPVGYPPGNTYSTDNSYTDTYEKLVYYNGFGITCPL
jgi:Glutaminase